MSIYTAIMLLTAGTILSGCQAITTAIEHRNLDVQSKMTDTVFLEPVGPGKQTVFLQVRNTSDQADLDLASDLRSAIQSHGYTIVSEPSQAHLCPPGKRSPGREGRSKPAGPAVRSRMGEPEQSGERRRSNGVRRGSWCNGGWLDGARLRRADRGTRFTGGGRVRQERHLLDRDRRSDLGKDGRCGYRSDEPEPEAGPIRNKAGVINRSRNDNIYQTEIISKAERVNLEADRKIS